MAARRVKRSFTLSPSSVAYLQKRRKAGKMGSLSAALDSALQELAAQSRREALEQAVVRYYDEATEEDRAEERAWGEAGLRGLASVDWDE